MARTTTMDVTGGGPYADIDGDVHLNANRFFVEGGIFSLGEPEAVTLVSNAATITKSFVVLDAEGAGTTDQLDTLTLAGAAQGDIVLLTVTATDTITVDDANIDLGAGTRAIAPGGYLALIHDGTSWGELFFLASADNT